jgi:hypothetical protein
MNKNAAGVFLALSIILAGCSSSPTANTPASPSQPMTTVIVPYLVGKTGAEAVAAGSDSGFRTTLLGTDGKMIVDLPEDLADVTLVSKTSPFAGDAAERGSELIVELNTTNEKIALAAEKGTLAIRYEFRCGDDRYDDSVPGLNSLQEVWKSPAYKETSECDVQIGGVSASSDGISVVLNEAEKAMVVKIGKSGGDISIPASAIADVLELCATRPEDGWDFSLGSDLKRIRAIASASASYCPKAPHIAEIRRVANGILPGVIDDGKHVAGRDFQPGTYQLQVVGQVSDCYWELSEPQGGIIANDFISLASVGPAVSIAQTQGFTSTRCGTWKKID